MKRIILTCVVFFLFATMALAAEFVASKNASKYHNPACTLAQKIKPENMVKFSSADEAAEKGYEPCKRCIHEGSSHSDQH